MKTDLIFMNQKDGRGNQNTPGRVDENGHLEEKKKPASLRSDWPAVMSIKTAIYSINMGLHR